MKLILFDIDGTLLRCGASPRRAFDRAFCEQFAVELAWGQTSAHGRTDLDIIAEVARLQLRRALGDAELQQLCSAYSRYLETELAEDHGYQVLTGAARLLEALAGLPSLLLGLQTGNLEAAAWHKLRRGGLDSYFQFGGFGSDHPLRVMVIRRAIERAEQFIGRAGFEVVVVVGDSPFDIQAGKEAGAATIAVASGRSSREELAVHGPDYIVDDLSSTDRLVELILNTSSC